jgi:hypothetical protein
VRVRLEVVETKVEEKRPIRIGAQAIPVRERSLRRTALIRGSRTPLVQSVALVLRTRIRRIAASITTRSMVAASRLRTVMDSAPSARIAMHPAADLLTEAAITAAATGIGQHPVLPRHDLLNHDLLSLVQPERVLLDMVHPDLAATRTASDAVRLLPNLPVRRNRRAAAIRVRSWICGSRLPVLPTAALMEGRAVMVAIALPATVARAQVMEAVTAAVISVHPAAVATLPADIRSAAEDTPAAEATLEAADTEVGVTGRSNRGIAAVNSAIQDLEPRTSCCKCCKDQVKVRGEKGVLAGTPFLIFKHLECRLLVSAIKRSD